MGLSRLLWESRAGASPPAVIKISLTLAPVKLADLFSRSCACVKGDVLNKRRVGVGAVEVKGKGTRAPHSNASIPREVNSSSNANTLSRFRKESSGLEGIRRLDCNGVGVYNHSPLET
jgi:hypothetical protein